MLKAPFRCGSVGVAIFLVLGCSGGSGSGGTHDPVGGAGGGGTGGTTHASTPTDASAGIGGRDGGTAKRPLGDGTYENYLDLVYVDGSDTTSHGIDVYVPGGDGPFPAIVYIHGGAWLQGDKYGPRNVIDREATRGYVVASINYRLTPTGVRWPTPMYDVKAAVRWLRAHAARYKIDPTRIAAWGDSAGAHLAAVLGTSAGVASLEDLSMGNASESSRVQAVLDWYGPTDFLQMDSQCDDDHDASDSAESELVGCAIQTCPDAVKAANPITYIDSADPPVLLFHGADDCTVPPGQSEIFDAALRNKGVSSQLRIFEGYAHNFIAFPNDEMWSLSEDFLDHTLYRQ